MAQDDYTPEQQKKIAKHFLLVAPHGEVKDLVKDLRGVMKESFLDEKWLQGGMTEYNKRRFEIAENDKTKVICCPQGEVEANKYLHPEKKIICTIDPISQKIVNESDGSKIVSGAYLEYREKASAKLKDYLNGFYEDGASNPASMSRGQGSVYVAPDGQMAVVISFKNLNVSNYWTGGWQSEWTVKVDKKGSNKLEGRIRLTIHYYEDGNVQLNSTFNEAGEVEVSDPSSTASALINTIQTLENDFQLRLEKFYVQMHDATFKNMRRFLPKTGTKFDWRSGVHRLASEATSK